MKSNSVIIWNLFMRCKRKQLKSSLQTRTSWSQTLPNNLDETELFLEEEYYTNIFPNPAIDFISISSNEHLKQITIFDNSAKAVLIANLNSRETINIIDIKKLAAGLYSYQIIKENGELINEKISIIK